jgi:hypothetical protein
MPIEIRELVIKASVSDSGADGRATSNNGNTSDAKEADVNLIVEKVLEILKDKSER